MDKNMENAELGTIPRRIKEARERLGLSQDDVGFALGKKQQQIAKWESQNIDLRINQLMEIAAVLKVPLTFLVGISSETDDSDEEKRLSPEKRRLLWYIDQGLKIEAMQSVLTLFGDDGPENTSV